MTEAATLARPYAKAAFDVAHGAHELKVWSEGLARLSTAAMHPEMQAVLGSPRMPKAAVADLLIDAAGSQLPDTLKNLVRLMAENRRLPYLPEVTRQFETLAARETGVYEATLVSARQPDAAQVQALADGLKRRTNREVRLHVEVDPTLVGGAYLRAGDQVIDGSVRGKLERLTAVLNH